MRMLVLAGGFGTRLQSVVNAVPKALAPVSDIPFLRYQIDNWVRQGVKSFVFLLHHQAEIAVEFLERERSRSLSGCDVDWVVESVPLGTGGAIANAIRRLRVNNEFLLTNADTWLGSGVEDLVGLSAPAMAVVEARGSSRYDFVEYDAQFRVRRFLEKGSIVRVGWINAGLLMLNAELFGDFDAEAFSLESVAFPRWAREGVLVAKPLYCDFIDIGIPQDYYRFRRWVESGRMNEL